MSTKMTIIAYINSDCCNCHLNSIDESIKRTYDVNTFLTSTSDRKISILHVPFPYDPLFEETVNLTIAHSDHVIILCSELHLRTVDFINRFNHIKISYLINGFINDTPARLWLDWFITTTYVYKNSQILDQLNPYQVKEKYFDILLGQRRPHRDFIYSNINKKQLTNNVIMTYLLDGSIPIPQQPIDNWLWEMPGLTIPVTNFNHTITTVNYYGYNISLSQIVPIDIYNQTAYSIVAETNFDNHYTFFTEKIVKPILARRLFIVFSGQYYLRNLRRLGFITFDNIIDESYDLIEEPVLRFELAFAQIEYLMQQPQAQILKAIKPIVEHNRNLILNTNWYEDFIREVKLLI